MDETEREFAKDAHFETLRENIRQEILAANDHLDIICGFLSAPDMNKTIMGKYPVFFHYTQWAHIKMLCINVYNATKPDGQTGNILRLLSYIKSHKKLSKLYSTNDIASIEEKLKFHSTFLESIYLLRDQYYAHNQLNKREAQITVGNIVAGSQLLLPDLGKIYDILSLKYDGSTCIFHTSPGVNVGELLKDLTELKKMKKLFRR